MHLKFSWANKGQMAFVGKKVAVLETPGKHKPFSFKGVMPWMVWKGFYFGRQFSARNRSPILVLPSLMLRLESCLTLTSSSLLLGTITSGDTPDVLLTSCSMLLLLRLRLPHKQFPMEMLTT